MTFKEIASKIKPTISPVLISVIVICYLCIGAIIFAHIEHSPELIKKRNGVEKFAEALDSFEDFQCKNETNSSVLRAKLKKILITWDEISTEYKLTQSDIDGLPIETDWSYYESLLFTYSLITTIGYGVVTPQTFTGRFFSICYAVIGIPLTMIGIANIGKFISLALLDIQERVQSIGLSLLNKVKKLWRKSSRKMRQPESDVSESDPVTMNSVSTLSPVTLFTSIFIYLMIGSLIIPSYEQMDFFTACYFCFISITTVGFGDVVPHGNPCPTLLYLSIGLALTTMAIELGAELLLKLHYFGRKFTNAKNALVRFGGRTLSVNDMVRAIGKKFKIPIWEIEAFTEEMDKFIEQTFVDKASGKLYPKPEATLLTTNPESVFKVKGEIDFADTLEDSEADL